MNLDKYIAQSKQSILDAMQIIEENKKGFVVVLEHEKVIGTLTDGDIRRAIISGEALNSPVQEVIKDGFEFLKFDATFDEIVEKFKTDKIEFLPVVDQNFVLKNILMKNQLHELLLEGKKLDINQDYSSMEMRRYSFEIFNRPWGFYKTVFLSEFVQAKIIQVFPNQQLSLQYHKKREEHWVVVKGFGQMTIGESIRDVSAGSYIFIPKGCQHRIKNISSEEPLIISEVQLGTYFGEDDIIRVDDIYGRV